MKIQGNGGSRTATISLPPTVVLLLVLACAEIGEAEGFFGFGDPRLKEAKKLTLAVYGEAELQPVAILQAERVFNDYQRRGFFRIGVLPMLVFEGLKLEIPDPDRLSSALTNVSKKLIFKANTKKAVEGRDFLLSCGLAKAGWLRARRVRLENSQGWELQEGTFSDGDSAPVAFSRATLVATGPQAGEVTCATASGVVRIHLCSLFSGKSP